LSAGEPGLTIRPGSGYAVNPAVPERIARLFLVSSRRNGLGRPFDIDAGRFYRAGSDGQFDVPPQVRTPAAVDAQDLVAQLEAGPLGRRAGLDPADDRFSSS